MRSLMYTASIGRVTIRSICADRPTLVQTLNLPRIDQHTRPLPFHSTGPAERQYKVWFPIMHAGFATQIKNRKMQCIAHTQKMQHKQGQNWFCASVHCIFHVRALRTTGWKPALNISIGIGQFDYANIGTSDIGITPESVVLYWRLLE